MKTLFPPLLSLALLAGCASQSRTAQAAAQAKQSRSVQARYWQIQEAQRTPPVRYLALQVPEQTENGAIRVPTTVYLPFP